MLARGKKNWSMRMLAIRMARLPDFKLLPVNFDETCRASQTIYIKNHQVRQNEGSLPSGRTLFAVGIPIGPVCTEV